MDSQINKCKTLLIGINILYKFKIGKECLLFLIKKQRFSKLLFTVCLTNLTITACIPIPHYQRESPNIEGRILINRSFAQNVSVGIETNYLITNGCETIDPQTYTNAKGEFRLGAKQQLLPMMTFGDQREAWGICFRFPDGRKALWVDSTPGEAPSSQELTCNFRRELLEIGSTLLMENTHTGSDSKNICQVNNT